MIYIECTCITPIAMDTAAFAQFLADNMSKLSDEPIMCGRDTMCDAKYSNIESIFTVIVCSIGTILALFQLFAVEKRDQPVNEEEQEYLDLLSELLNEPLQPNRTVDKTRTLFAQHLSFNLMRGEERVMPLLTTKFVPMRLVAEELRWFLRGSTTTDDLVKNNVHIWDSNATREFLDSQGLNYRTGTLGPIYGYQWRNWNTPYDTLDAGKYNIKNSYLYDYIHSRFGYNIEKYNVVINYNKDQRPNLSITGLRRVNVQRDQIQAVIEGLKTDPFSRRHIVTAWNPEQLSQMALPPCHYAFQFVVKQDELGLKYLNCLVNMRSADMALGVPFNIASYALLTHVISYLVNMTPGELVIMMADCHIYESHEPGIRKQIQRTPKQFPTIKFTREFSTIDEFANDGSSFAIFDYDYDPVIKYKIL